MIHSTNSKRWIAFIVSASASIAVGWYAVGALRKEAPTVIFVDTTAEIAEKMNERLAPGAEPVEKEPGEGYPSPLVREVLDEETAALFFPGIRTGNMTYDPHAYVVRVANMRRRYRRFAEHRHGGFNVRTNEYGMREDRAVDAVEPDLRILVTGDSHTDGVCDNSESFANVLEGLLADDMSGETVDVLNAGTGFHNLYNYLGTFERLVDLDPDILIVTVYGGNDFSGAMHLQRYFHRRPAYEERPFRWKSGKVDEGLRSLGAQEIVQEVHFLNQPDDVAVAVDLACSISLEIASQCAAVGVQPLFVYLPPPCRGQPHHFGEDLRSVAAANGLDASRLVASDRISDGWLVFLAERGLSAIDLRPAFAETEALLYWRTDHHLNVAGHALVAAILRERVLALTPR